MLGTFFGTHTTMAPRINATTAQNIENDYFLRMRPSYIATRYPEVSRATVYNLCNNLRDFGAAYPILPLAPIGRPRLIAPSIELELQELLAERSTLYLDELQFHILLNHQLLVSESTISRAIKHAEFTRKVTQRIAA